MNILIILFATLFSFAPPVWLKDLEQAKTMAREQNKMILLNFSGSDWCAPCIRLKKEIFLSETFTQYASENLVLVNVDFPRLKKNQLSDEQVAKNDKLTEQYNPKGSLPFTLLLDPEGNVIHKWEGVPVKEPSDFPLLIKSAQE